jgi:hypothetical protein
MRVLIVRSAQGELATLECLATVLTALAGTTSALAAACSLACRALEVSHTGVPVREDYAKYSCFKEISKKFSTSPSLL